MVLLADGTWWDLPLLGLGWVMLSVSVLATLWLLVLPPTTQRESDVSLGG